MQLQSQTTTGESSRAGRAMGLQISLVWSRSADGVKVTVLDERLRESFDIHVEGADALPAFHHPFAYAAAARGGARGCGRDRLFVPQQA